MWIYKLSNGMFFMFQFITEVELYCFKYVTFSGKPCKTSKCMALKSWAKFVSRIYATTAVMPLQQLRHYISYDATTVTLLQQLLHYSSYAPTPITPIQQLRHYSSYASNSIYQTVVSSSFENLCTLHNFVHVYRNSAG